ncbi:multicomponent Na+:H+ antiporter subunit E [Orenia metallireducens]|jgi:multicomponent Na+:H+ antiporter subunit E|uniref:Multicomponent Na+:H+ antiporter subunit E n=1 Tax=Orenia metallireducens TaxID=1413210 RepID=A0A285HSD8_9FIRM|nr:Na+/H+ antiporter subunit E [Orenia metallireducens]PRX27959.1 multicomponent Na+:H+ antiporter subunit E [Orenia metallireducens]SNY37641.1 multicomponent Na+:H+ antiporter subunit E [Orenia metallireducens]
MRIFDKDNIYTVILLYAVWIIITGNFSYSSLILGLAISAIVVLFINSSFTQLFSKKILTKPWIFLWYISYLGLQIFISSYKVAYLVLHPKRPFKSAIVKLPTDVGQQNRLIKLTILANAITLTPGTITMDLSTETQELYIHCLNLKSDDDSEIREDIFGKFEEIIRRMFQ